ncbi:sulfate transporter family protein [Methylopila henanensis]|uniref:Sulfate transporter family protein n=1 Tax=Methylopila henanensis TaxID=873516 RepID=A0ABW4K521_9HYPH
MLDSAIKAARQVFSPPFRAVLLKSLGLTLLLLAVGWIGLQALAEHLLTLQNPTLNLVARIVAGLGTALGMLFLVVPVTAAIAGLFLDDIAEVVEREHYPQDPSGAAVPLVRGLALSVRFGLLVLGLNLLMLPLLFVPVIGQIIWLVVNAYLLSREYFSLAAMRFRSEADATALRRRNRFKVFAAGLVTAALVIVPFANLLTPLFATAFFVHLHKRIARADAQRLGTEASPPRLRP